ncbi:MAG: TrkH family potassium uptake protein [Pseudomonadota bacterium]
MNEQPQSNKWIFIILILATAALFLEYGIPTTRPIRIAIHVLDFSVLILFIFEMALRLIQARYKSNFLKRHWFDVLFLIFFTTLFLYSKYHTLLLEYNKLENLSIKVIFARNLFLALKIFIRFNKLNYFFTEFTKNPAQTMVLSFLFLISVGTLFLMMSFTTADKTHLGFLDALFTATSAVCVTGLIVVDTATRFSFWGQLVIMCLIQAGGLGIMMFTYTTAFILGRRLTLKEKIALSYMLNENDMRKLYSSIIKIVGMTFLIEAIGMVFLFSAFQKQFGLSSKTIFFSAFHAISAFCNAGFALFTTSLEAFKSNSLINLTVAFLIILGGISFPVLMNLFQHFKSKFYLKYLRKPYARTNLNMNTKSVLVTSLVLIIAGTLLIYGFEHKTDLINYDLKTQYLAAFFQSVTLRTAGFNTLDIAHLQLPTYLLMLLFMFIGGAAGSTAGGIKVNSLAVIYSYIRAVIKNQYSVVLYGHFLQKYLVSRALLIVILASLAIFTGTIILSITEATSFMNILFEVVSAFGTVGLSTGITSALTSIGKSVIIIMMFLGRLGPLTIMAAFAAKKTFQPKYPEGEINLG